MKKVLLYLALVLAVVVCMCACVSTNADSASATSATGKTASSSYEHDPRLNPEAMKDIVGNPDACCGLYDTYYGQYVQLGLATY